MSLPSIEEIRVLTRKCVIEADKKDTLHTFTIKLMRRELEKELNLDEGDLDVAEYRRAIKATIETTMAEIGTKKEQEASSTATKPGSSKKTRGKKRSSDAGLDEMPKKKAKVNKDQKGGDGKVGVRDLRALPNAHSERKKSGKRKGKATNKKGTSPSTDEEMIDAPANPPDEDKPAQTGPSTEQRKEAPARIDDSEDEVMTEDKKVEQQSPKAKPTGGDVTILGPNENPEPPNKKDTTDYKSESELSVLIDEPPKRKRKTKTEKNKSTDKKSSSSTKRSTKATARRSENLSKDEETIKKLKSLVLACGVRKVWSKVFQGLEAPAKQIEKLKDILRELGMTGRLSMEKAKAIREKREFEQELQDVQEFEKAVTRTGRGQDTTIKEDDKRGSSSDEDEENENPNPRRRRMTAAQSISAFLGDQSSDDD
ncbi:hypothetical protein D9756_002223 [Leucocoprinus leucothites]|uniref:DEK C-terminal domain-containing protein n=1 Tax=Leucocoprinus leucothites TaxID=201217 RepID=A0A8H5GCB8_9AGAR|nr:hypothetical protein D9756_002223 [Leucoagaricus leucothites]